MEAGQQYNYIQFKQRRESHISEHYLEPNNMFLVLFKFRHENYTSLREQYGQFFVLYVATRSSLGKRID